LEIQGRFAVPRDHEKPHCAQVSSRLL